MKFKDIKIGHSFIHNGTFYTKKTTRTAYITEHRFFYFGLNEEINIARTFEDVLEQLREVK